VNGDLPITAAGGAGHGAVSVPAALPQVGVVILTQGTRPVELQRAAESALDQTGVELDVVVVGNGWEPVGVPAGVRTVHLPANVGIPAGRNHGITEVRGDLVFLLDDDAALPDPGTLARVAQRFAAERDLGIAQLRIVDPTGAESPRRYVPRLRAGDPAHSSDVTTFCEGAAAIRRDVFDRAGMFTDAFWYAHEGTDLAWRALDAGYRVHYVGDEVAHHPATVPTTRHVQFHYLNARNRVWLARRHLPLPLALIYPLVWFVLTLARSRDAAALRQALRGYWHGLVQPCGTRRPLRWSTVWRMTRAGRPPII
jgi:GT2 family glycosyltransferase